MLSFYFLNYFLGWERLQECRVDMEGQGNERDWDA